MSGAKKLLGLASALCALGPIHFDGQPFSLRHGRPNLNIDRSHCGNNTNHPGCTGKRRRRRRRYLNAEQSQ
jgi:hypothetical protein